MPQGSEQEIGTEELSNTDDPSRPSMTVTSKLLLPGGVSMDIPNTLLDTGASTNYMSLAFFKKHRNLFKRVSVIPGKSKVRLGDGMTYKDILFMVTIRLGFDNVLGYDTKGGTDSTKEIKINVNVFDNNSYDLIIGLPTLIGDLFHYFLDMLEIKRSALLEEIKDLDNLNSLEYGDLVQPFPFRTEEAPEEVDTELPAHGREFLFAMEHDYEERKAKYFSLFDSHVSEEFTKAVPILELLRTKGLKVFVADNWDGIRGMEPVEFKFKEDLPESHPCKARPINPKLAENFYKELERLCGYLFIPSKSSIVSPIVVAYKATFPFIRVCGDFTWINKYIVMPIVPIPAALPCLAKIAKFKYFIDVDVTNAFHQIPLGPITSERLSIVTPFKTLKPKFLLEGTTPATGILHSTMIEMFKDFDEWSIVLFDNILLLANSYEEAFELFDRFLDRCIERNLFLKFDKSWLGVQEVNFFGYQCRHLEYMLTEERTKAIMEMVMPNSIKGMQRFLGSCLMYKSFIPNYSQHTALLNEMTHGTFPWADESKWQHDYRKAFNDFKQVLCNSFKLFYPDYSLPWILRVDASSLGIGSVLLQQKGDELQPIMFQSSKFSTQAQKWSTIEQECYAIYYSVHKLAYYLRCKEFIIETDHRNLVWMSTSQVPKIIRWHIYLQSFNFLIRHIPGKYNLTADMLSRQWPSDIVKEFADALHHLLILNSGEKPNFESVMRQVHNARVGHFGVGKTWKILAKQYPGHGFPVAWVADYIAECPTCQKDRLRQVASIPGVVKTLHVDRATSMVGCDTYSVLRSDDGYEYICVIVNFFTRFVKLYPTKDKGALTTATCIFDYICNFGLFDELRMDPGTEFTNEVLEHLLKWLGTNRNFTLAKNPQADGVEGTNKQIHRHLIALCMDENCKHQWSSPTVLPIIQLILNEHLHSETGVIPMHAQFGDTEAILRQIPAGKPISEATHIYVKLLADNLKMIRRLSAEYQAGVKKERENKTPIEAANQYQQGDFVTYRIEKMQRMDKLTPRNQGPFEVIRHIPETNWVEVRDLVYGDIKTFDLKDLTIFLGTKEDATNRAGYDSNQHGIDCIIGHRGNPELRSSMEFYVRFNDNTAEWITFNNDLSITLQFERYCQELPQLRQLLIPAHKAKTLKSDTNKLNITLVHPKSVVYVDIREWGPGQWYSKLDLPNKDTLTYVIRCEYRDWCGSGAFERRKILAYFPVLRSTWEVDNWFVSTYGHKFTELLPNHVLVTRQLIEKHKLRLD